MKILIIANSRFKGGLSGGDAIYESFKKFWPECEFDVWTMEEIDYRPFVVCYIHRILRSVLRALVCNKRYELVYSASDFLPDSLPGFILKLKGRKWVAGFYLKAFKENWLHYYSQKMVRQLIEWFADMVIVTNPTMYCMFPYNKKTWINGGIDLSLAGLSDEPKIYDAVFCGRIHPSKGIDELIEIWDLVRRKKPDARLAVIGDGDLGKNYIKEKLFRKYGYANYNGMDLLGYMGNERFDIYKKSKLVLYPTPLKYAHFSMAPVEAMACGCVLVYFHSPIMNFMLNKNDYVVESNNSDFAKNVLQELSRSDYIINSIETADWAKKFDYKTQSLRVYEEVKNCVSC